MPYKYETYGTLKEDSRLREIFPDGIVPLISIIPSQVGLYRVNVVELTDDQVLKSANKILEKYKGECRDLEHARDYIHQHFFVSSEHFRCFSTNNPAILMSILEDEGMGKCTEDIEEFDDWESEEEFDDALF